MEMDVEGPCEVCGSEYLHLIAYPPEIVGEAICQECGFMIRFAKRSLGNGLAQMRIIRRYPIYINM